MTEPYSISYRYSLPPGARPPASPPAAAQAGEGRRSLAARLWLAAAAIATALSLWAHLLIGLNNDHMTLMDQARRMLEGQVPYVDYTDIGPPLIHIIFVLPLTLSALTGWPVYISLTLFTYALIAVGLAAALRMLSASGMDRQARWIIVTAMAVALLGVSLINQVFGDREHLMMVLAAPWFVLYSPLVDRRSVPLFWRVLVAILAGVGFAIKPYFYVFYLATVAYALCYGSSVRQLMRQLEHYIVGLLALTYLAVVLIWFPEYPRTVIPVGLKTYAAISWSGPDKTAEILNTLILGYGLTGIAAVFALWIAAPSRYGRDITYLFFLLLAGIASYLLNGGWYYTQYPYYALAFMLAVAAGVHLVAAAAAIRDRRRSLRWMLAVCVALATGLGVSYAQPAWWRADWDMRLQRAEGHTLATALIQHDVRPRIEAHLDAHPRFMFFSSNLWSVNLMKEGSPRRNVGRFDYVWPLPGILALKGQKDYESLRDWFSGSIADDLERHAPELVINDVSPYQRSLPPSYGILDFLKTDPRFVHAWAHYRLVEKLNGCSRNESANCAYEIYYRK